MQIFAFLAISAYKNVFRSVKFKPCNCDENATLDVCLHNIRLMEGSRSCMRGMYYLIPFCDDLLTVVHQQCRQCLDDIQGGSKSKRPSFQSQLHQMLPNFHNSCIQTKRIFFLKTGQYLMKLRSYEALWLTFWTTRNITIVQMVQYQQQHLH